MAKKKWFDAFSESMNTVFTDEEFEKYREMVAKDLKHYSGYIRPGSKILDLGCGLGCTAVPLSAFGYTVVGLDNDPKVVGAAKKNAERFGKDVRIAEGNVFEAEKIFGKNSFDACISGGLLEHFKKEEIRELVAIQLALAPVVIATMPVKTDATKKHYGFTEETALNNVTNSIYRNFWSEDEWVSDVLAEFTVVEHFVQKVDATIGNFEELWLVIKRD